MQFHRGDFLGEIGPFLLFSPPADGSGNLCHVRTLEILTQRRGTHGQHPGLGLRAAKDKDQSVPFSTALANGTFPNLVKGLINALSIGIISHCYQNACEGLATSMLRLSIYRLRFHRDV